MIQNFCFWIFFLRDGSKIQGSGGEFRDLRLDVKVEGVLCRK